MNFSRNIVKNVIEYRYLHDNLNIINIAYGIDDNYARCMAASIASFCINNKNKNFCFYIVASDLLNETKIKLEVLAKIYNIDIIIYEINKDFFYDMPVTHDISLATYFRILLPDMVVDIDKLYYIDADIVCLKDAEEFFNIDLEDNIIAAVSDGKKMNNKRNKALNLKQHIYFNAGVLIINIKKWNDNKISDKVLSIINKYRNIIKYEDQDALNIVLSRKIKYISKKFNCLNLRDINNKEIILLHFASHPKPWNEDWSLNFMYNNFTKDLYKQLENKTPWMNSPLEKNSSYKNKIKWRVKNILFKLGCIK
ncbi:glycosyltransferase family 8 protein [Megamonas funiformis]|uniref:glycosyltransferase family 8 protein n=1 Tax=Megamonas funiformis TaxID=437897 RepID=UPI00388E84E2